MRRFDGADFEINMYRSPSGGIDVARNGLQKFVERHLQRLEAGLKEILSCGDIRAVHKFRVSTRRLNEPLQLLAKADPSVKKPVKKSRRALKALRNLFGDVRDLDVLQMSLAEPKTAPDIDDQSLAQLRDVLAERRRSAFASAVDALERHSPAGTHGAVQALVKSCTGNDDADLRKALLSAGRAMWRKRAERLMNHVPNEGDSTNFHALRIDLKGLRYCTELLLQMENREEEAVLSVFVAMQNALGAWNDHLFAARCLAAVATEDEHYANDPQWSAAILTYAADRVRASHRNRREALDRWPVLRDIIESAQSGEAIGRSMSVDAEALATALTNVVTAD